MQTLGIIDIVWKGRTIPVKTGAKLRLGGIKNTATAYGRGVGRFQEFQGSEITATTNLEKGQSLVGLLDHEEGELQVVCDTGQTYVFEDAFLEGDRPETTGATDGQIELKWAAGEAQEIIG